MHIVFVCREYPPTLRGGGIASYIHEMAINLIRRAHSVTVICASDDTRVFSDRKEDGIRVIRLSGGDFILPQIEKIFFNQENALFISVFLLQKENTTTDRTIERRRYNRSGRIWCRSILFVKVPCTGCYPPSYTNFA